MPLDRTQAPAIEPITHFDMPHAQCHRLHNGANLYTLNAGKQEVVGLEIFFNSGTVNQPANGVSFFMAKMLAEGTKAHTSKQITEQIAQYGAFMEVQTGAERTFLSVYTLPKFLPNLLPLIAEIVTQASFPEEELENLKNISLQQHRVNLEKTAYLAGVQFKKEIFGANHPLSVALSEEVIMAQNSEQLRDYYAQTVAVQPFEVMLSGHYPDSLLKAIDQTLGQIVFGAPAQKLVAAPAEAAHKQRFFLPKEGSVQASVRVGRAMVSRKHPDYLGLRLLNEIFGGYFGSRLMKNIREEKGYTYGIHSSVVPTFNSGYMVIGTDVNKNVAESTIEEIYKEMEILRTELVPADELETVRNYMLGSFANSINTPFALAERFKTVHFDGLKYDYYNQYINAIRSTTAEQLQHLAQKYYDPAHMTEVIVGGI